MIKLRYVFFYLRKKIFFFNNYPKGVIFPNKILEKKYLDIKLKTISESIESNHQFQKLIKKKIKFIEITTNKLYCKNKNDYFFANFYLFNNKFFFYERNKRRFYLKNI